MTPDAQQPKSPTNKVMGKGKYWECVKGFNCVQCSLFSMCIDAPPCSRPHTPTPDCKYQTALEACNGAIEDAARTATLAAEQTDNILSVLKKRYKDEMAILDYVEMIECEVLALRQQPGTTAHKEQHP